MSIAQQIFGLLVMSLAVANITQTFVKEEIFRQVQEYCKARRDRCNKWYFYKAWYMLTCEYCFSHHVTWVLLLLTGFRVVYEDWRGVLLAFLAIPFIANYALTKFAQPKVEIQKEKKEIELKDKQLNGDK